MSRKIFTVLLAACFSVIMLGKAYAEDAVITLVGYSPQQVIDLELETERSMPLQVIGVGQPVYLMSEHEGTYSWSLTGPSGSTAALSSNTTREVWFIPDKVGSFTVTLDFTDSEGASSSASIVITGANYVGVGIIGDASPSFSKGQCAACHSDVATTWAETGHANMLERGLDGIVSSHYTESCIECHSVGYDTDSLAVNGGFDDVAAEEGWVFPDTLVAGNFQSLVDSFPNTAQLANIQCESCHGPGSQHKGTGPIGRSYDAAVCAYCHEEGSRHYFPTAWRNSLHGLRLGYDDPFNRAGTSCVGCHTAEGFFEVQIDQVTPTAPYDMIHGVTCAVCHNPHEVTVSGMPQLRLAGDQTMKDSETGEPIYQTDGTPAHACDVCHHLRPNTSTPGAAPHESHQTDMLNGTVGWMNPDKTYPESNPHGTLNEERCAGCHMHAASSVARQNYIGSHTFAVQATDDSGNQLYLTEACTECHPGTGEDFDYHGVQSQVTLMQNELQSRLPVARTGRLAGLPAYASADLTEGYITETQMNAAYNWFIVRNDGSRGVHNPALVEALLEDALDSNPKSAACASCDVNGDGKLGIADAVKLILMAGEDNTQACIDRNDDYKYDLLDVIQLLGDIWTGECGGGMLAAAGVELVNEKMDLTAEQIQYVEGVIAKLELTSEQEVAFRIALYGDGSGRSSLPKAFALAQNSPNPFNPATTISYSVPEGRSVNVNLRVYDIRGRLVATLINEVKEAGTYTVFWEGATDAGQKVASGVYFYRMQAGEYTQTRKMVVLK